MQPHQHGRRLEGKPNWRNRRLIRASEKYQAIKHNLDTTDEETMLLTRLGDLHQVAPGEKLNGQIWSRTYAVVGLDVALRVATSNEIHLVDEGPTEGSVGNDVESGSSRALSATVRVSAPWVVRDVAGSDAELAVGEAGVVLILDRRHLHLADRSLSGRAEPVDPIVNAVNQTRFSVPTSPVGGAMAAESADGRPVPLAW